MPYLQHFRSVAPCQATGPFQHRVPIHVLRYFYYEEMIEGANTIKDHF